MKIAHISKAYQRGLFIGTTLSATLLSVGSFILGYYYDWKFIIFPIVANLLLGIPVWILLVQIPFASKTTE